VFVTGKDLFLFKVGFESYSRNYMTFSLNDVELRHATFSDTTSMVPGKRQTLA
jgi:hypothetical protein